MLSGCRRPFRRCLTSRRCHQRRRSCRHEIRPCRRFRCFRQCHPFHHCCHPFHRRSTRRSRSCRRQSRYRSRPCRRFPTSHRYSDRQSASQCSCPTCCHRCLTSQSAMTTRTCRLSAHPGPRHPFCRDASCFHRIHPACSRLRVMIPLTSFPKSRSTTHRIPTSPACRSYRDPCRRRSTHDFGSGPPWFYPPTYFDCDLSMCDG
jgi:hypothetical protein